MPVTKVDLKQVENIVNDKMAEAIDELCRTYGIDCIEWYYPYDADAEQASIALVNAIADGIEETLSWYRIRRCS